MTDFHLKRRQQFLTQENYEKNLIEIPDFIRTFQSSPTGTGDTLEECWMRASWNVADSLFDFLIFKYTAGEPILPLRDMLEDVLVAYESYAEKLRAFYNDPDEPAFDISSTDYYPNYLWLISLCYLLHRKDLLTRVAKLVDGENDKNASWDFNVECLLGMELERYDTLNVVAPKPYMHLADAFSEDENDISKKHLDLFLQNWYSDLKATPWYDVHLIRNDAYTGYWAFSAAAVVYLFEIEDDSQFHEYLYYPKDLVAFARSFDANPETTKRHRCEAGKKCPVSGYWYSPANKDLTSKHFNEGEVMPDIGDNPWGQVIWYLNDIL